MRQVTDPGIDTKHLRKFPRQITKVITEAVNKHGVTYRMIDGSHIRLFCGDRNVIPIKIAAERPAEYTMGYLIRWLEENIPSWTERDVTPEEVETLAEVVNTRPVKVRAVVDSPAEVESTGEQEASTQPAPPPIPGDLICTWPGCGRENKTAGGYRMHWAGHTGEKKKQAAKATASNALRREQKKVIATQAISALAELHGIKIGADERRVKALEAKVEKLTKERDDALARISLMNEAFKGLG